MRKSPALDALFPRTRQAILAATLLHPERWWYLSDLARHLGVRPSSLQRELAALVKAGILDHRRDGNRVYVQANPHCPFLLELQGLLAKTVGLVEVLRDALVPFVEHIVLAFIYGSVARADEIATSDVDVMIIGRIGLADLASALRQAEQQVGRPINPTLYTREEFVTKLHAGQHFLTRVLEGKKLFIVGEPHELATVVSQSPGTATYHESSGA